jgi:sporulation protein YlmC with PRC-barrel domain
MIAAMMTAANLGARVTGWGFVVFTVGSIAWTIVGVSSGQTNLIAANAFLTIVNLVGIWRWLGREAKYQDSANAVAARSEVADMSTLAPASNLIGRPVVSRDGDTIATVVDAMVACDDFRMRGLLVSHGGVGGVGERIILLQADSIDLSESAVSTDLDADDLSRLPLAREAAHTLA